MGGCRDGLEGGMGPKQIFSGGVPAVSEAEGEMRSPELGRGSISIQNQFGRLSAREQEKREMAMSISRPALPLCSEGLMVDRLIYRRIFKALNKLFLNIKFEMNSNPQ